MTARPRLRIEFISEIAQIGEREWNQLGSNSEPPNYPFTRHEFLSALEQTKCVGSDSGWLARHLVAYRGNKLVAALPSYVKSHSYGEYVFDWSWAQAYAQAGLEYYPKLISAIPFTPVPGPRLICDSDENCTDLMTRIFGSVQAHLKEEDYSGWHLLFPQTALMEACQEIPFLTREDIQFHWSNNNYQSFDDFLSTLRSSKRKQLRRERRIVADQGIEMQRYSGSEITPWVLDNFYICYCQTYLRRSGHRGYLNQKFFQKIAETMADQMMIVLALKDGQPIASSLFFFDRNNLYGRYWGAIRDIDCLHFEACYYQGIDFAIERNLLKFNPGTQGEHKLVRGFKPTKTHSLHWVQEPQFQNALEDFMQRESEYKAEYQAAAEECLPFRRDQATPES